MPGQHAPLQPSDCETWVVCHAKPGMVANLYRSLPVVPEHEQASVEGTGSHWVIPELVANRVVAEGQITDDGAGTVLSQDMIDGAQLFVDDVTETVPHIPRSAWHVEERVYMPSIHQHCWGTPDLWLFDPSTWTIYVWDYKFGHGIVEVFENWQLMCYLVGIMLQLKITDDIPLKVVFTIVQPRAFHNEGPVRRWRVESAANLRSYWNRMTMAAEQAMTGFAPATPNANCGYCEARHVCTALQRDAYRSADLALQSVPVLMPATAVGTELAMLQDAAVRLQARIEGLLALAQDMVGSGKAVPGFGFTSANAREEFDEKKLAEAKIALSLFGVSPVKDKALTPNQVRDALAAAVPGLTRPQAATMIADYLLPRKTVRKFGRSDDSEGSRMFGVF